MTSSDAKFEALSVYTLNLSQTNGQNDNRLYRTALKTRRLIFMLTKL